jgi:hypothetical protein
MRIAGQLRQLHFDFHRHFNTPPPPPPTLSPVTRGGLTYIWRGSRRARELTRFI